MHCLLHEIAYRSDRIAAGLPSYFNVNKQRILMFGWEFPPFNSGGLGVACLGLTRALSSRGLDVIFVMPKMLDIKTPWAKMVYADSPATTAIETYAVDSILKPYVSSQVFGRTIAGSAQGGGAYAGDLLSEVMRYAASGGAIAKQESFDIIYAHDWLAFGAGIAAKRASGKPLIVHVHATEVDRTGSIANANPAVYAIEKEGMEAADTVIAVSQFTKDIIVKDYGIPAEKIRVVHNGIDEATMPRPAETAPRLRALQRAGYSVVLFLGRITLQKGPDYFLRAAARVLERNRNVFFVVSGSGDMDQSMVDLAARLGIADRVLFTGFLQGDDRAQAYAAADLFIMPSVSEPFGITPLESMKMGTPVIISKQSGVSEVVKHALKVDFWDIDDIANKILGIIGSNGLRATIRENAQREAATITWADAARKIDGVIHELVVQ